MNKSKTLLHYFTKKRKTSSTDDNGDCSREPRSPNKSKETQERSSEMSVSIESIDTDRNTSIVIHLHDNLPAVGEVDNPRNETVLDTTTDSQTSNR